MGVPLLIQCLLHKNIHIKRKAAETLSFLFKEVDTRAALRVDILHLTLIINTFTNRTKKR